MFKFGLMCGLAAVPQIAVAQGADVPAIAAEAGDVAASEESSDRIVVTARGVASLIMATGQTVTVITAAEIAGIQGPDPVRVLQRVPGAAFSRNGGLGGYASMRLRGAEAEQLLVLIDGVRAADPAAPGGGYDLGNLVAGTLDRVEVLRGTNSTIWGSDAIGGVMALSTRSGEGMSASLEAGSRGSLAAQAQAGVATDALSASLYGAWTETDGFSAAASGTEADGFRQLATGASLRLALAPGLDAFGHANFRSGVVEIDGYPAPDYLLADTAETQETDQLSGNAGLAYTGDRLRLRAAYAAARTERANFDTNVPSFSSDGRDQRVSLRGTHVVTSAWELAFGAEHGWSAMRVSYESAGQFRADSTAGYLQAGYAKGPLALHAGARIEDYQGYGTRTNLGGDAVMALGPDLRLRASLGEGFKAPTLYQLFSQDYGNRDLRPEESLGGDIGIEWGNRGGPRHLAVTAFRRDSDNLIQFDFATFRYGNTARARAQGIEVEAGFAPVAGLRLGGSYGYVDATDRETGLALARRPRHSATVYGDATLPFGLTVGSDVRLAGASFDDGFEGARLPGYVVVDLRAALALGQHITLFGRVENAFDRAYQTAGGYASPPRGVFAGVGARM